MRSRNATLRAAILLVAARLMLRRAGTTGTLRRLTGGLPRRPWAIEPERALQAVRRAGRVTGGACLPQAVALTALLKRTGAEPVLVLGCLRTLDGTWSAHAWVLLADEMLEPVQSAAHSALAYLDEANGWVPLAAPTTP